MPTAADVVNALDQQSLASILRTYGEEKHAKKIASAVVHARSVYPITRTQQLASIVAGTFINSEQCLREKKKLYIYIYTHILIPQTPRGIHLYLKSDRMESCLYASVMPLPFGFAGSPLQHLCPHTQFKIMYCSLLINLIIDFFFT